MHLNLSKFKKVRSDKLSTTMRHEDGHTIDIIHKALSPKMRAQLIGMPHSEENQKEPIKLAEGTPDAPVASPIETPAAEPMAATETPSQPAPTEQPQAAPSVDPALEHKRQLYNFFVAGLTPSSGVDPRAIAGAAMTFGPNGEEPTHFNPQHWAQAEQAAGQEQQFAIQGQQVANAKAMEENKYRQAAGLAPIPVPEAPQAATSPEGQPTNTQLQGQKPSASPQDPYGTEATQKAYLQGIQESGQGILGQAQAAQQQADAQARIYGNAVKQQQKIFDDYQTQNQKLNTEHDTFMKDYKAQHIDPNHFFSDKSTGSKIATGIGLILGGMGGALTHQGNPAMDFLNKQIDRDISAQQSEMDKKANLLSANFKQFGNMRDAAAMTKAMTMSIVADKLGQAAAQAASPMARAQAFAAMGALNQQSASIRGQMAARHTLLGAANTGAIAPERVVQILVPPEQRSEATKELKEAQDATSLRDNTLSAFDQLVKVNTMGNALTHPIQTPLQVNALRGAALDKLTKDTSGRVTPETVKLIGGLFDTKFASPETVAIARRRITDLLSQGMHYPTLKFYGVNPDNLGRFNSQGGGSIQEAAPILKK